MKIHLNNTHWKHIKLGILSALVIVLVVIAGQSFANNLNNTFLTSSGEKSKSSPLAKFQLKSALDSAGENLYGNQGLNFRVTGMTLLDNVSTIGNTLFNDKFFVGFSDPTTVPTQNADLQVNGSIVIQELAHPSCISSPSLCDTLPEVPLCTNDYGILQRCAVAAPPACVAPTLFNSSITLDNANFTVNFNDTLYDNVAMTVSGYYTSGTVFQTKTSATTNVSPVYMSTYFGNGTWDVRYSARCKSTGTNVTSNTIQVSNSSGSEPGPSTGSCANKKWVDGSAFAWDGSKYYTPTKTGFSPYDPGANSLCGSYHASTIASGTTTYWLKMECLNRSQQILGIDGWTYIWHPSYNFYATSDFPGYSSRVLSSDGNRYTTEPVLADPIYGVFPNKSRRVDYTGVPYNITPAEAITTAPVWFSTGSGNYTRYVPVAIACS